MQKQLVDQQTTQDLKIIRTLRKRTLENVIKIGRRLIAIKDRLAHGEWLPLLERELGWNEQTALNFMRVAEMAETKNFLDLDPIPVSALYMLAAPSTPPKAVERVIARSRRGEALKTADIKQEIAKTKLEESAKAVHLTITNLNGEPSGPVPDLKLSVIREHSPKLKGALLCIESIAGAGLIPETVEHLFGRSDHKDLDKAEAAILALLNAIKQLRETETPVTASREKLH